MSTRELAVWIGSEWLEVDLELTGSLVLVEGTWETLLNHQTTNPNRQ